MYYSIFSVHHSLFTERKVKRVKEGTYWGALLHNVASKATIPMKVNDTILSYVIFLLKAFITSVTIYNKCDRDAGGLQK